MKIPVSHAFTSAHALHAPVQQRRARLSPVMALGNSNSEGDVLGRRYDRQPAYPQHLCCVRMRRLLA